ncbi:hypothetical protein NAC44_01390 [Allorhizobium sp. BGMRC 0089]|uniref:hypothetical protein n=1 Tax=Allorhizobium sonneratiae TaxID=2934936 RepID=UPI0020342873|nr:hypothetical protein [Allorhizobium sonneratiae]MCM2290980.1 hypothetical protein [Allorhizobium sonneratiae]
MADFVAVIRRAVDGLSNNTPEMRVKVYEKARGAVTRQLQTMTPKLSEDMLSRQLEKLEAAIAEVESDYAEALPPLEEDVPQDVFAGAPEPEPAAEPEREPEPEPEAEPVHEPVPHAPEAYAGASSQSEAYHHETHADEEVEHEAESHQTQSYAPVHTPFDAPWAAPASEPEHYRADEPHHATPLPFQDEPEDRHDPHGDIMPEQPPVAAPWMRHEEVLHAPVEEPVVYEPLSEPQEENEPRHPMDDWVHSNFGAVTPPPSLRRPVDDEAADESAGSRQDANSETDLLSDFDAFVRTSTADKAEDRREARSETAHWDSPMPMIEPGKPGEHGGDPAWFSDFSGVAAASQPKPSVDPAPDLLAASATLPPPLLKKGRGLSGKRPSAGALRRYGVSLAVLLILVGAAFFAYQQRDRIGSMVGSLTSTATDKSAATTSKAPAQSQAAADGAGADGQKFTQRLMPDGSEVDAGQAPASADTAEGKSVAQQNVAANVPAAPSSQDGAKPVPFTIPANGQKAYLYEEQVGQATPTTLQGYVVWSAQTEHSDDGKSQPVIQGKLTIPERGLTALITFKRNTDPSLPASHLAELVFSVPKSFDGGGIDSVQRIAMKATEQDRGDPIVAVPAKITDDTFMIAFNDFPDVVKRNIDMLRQRQWIDIPISYNNGRRALITLDKGTVGQQIFDKVINEWGPIQDKK